jgi:hypothetical protein
LDHYWLQERRFRRQLQEQGRYNSLFQGMDALKGTLIVDSAAVNHSRVRVWWTPDNVQALATVPIPTRRWREKIVNFGGEDDPDAWDPFDEWVYEKWLNPKHGTAQLLYTELEKAPPSISKLHERFPTCEIVVTYSYMKLWKNISLGKDKWAD